MKKAKKVVALLLCAVLLVVGSVAGTLAYLADTDDVVNTFTVGKVDIKLDEKNTDGKDADGNPNNAERDQANEYKLLPGLTYEKDPTVTVLKDSENSYIKMTMTLSHASELDAIFNPNGATMTDIFKGYNPEKWIYKGNVKNTADDTRTYEFWYSNPVEALTADVPLEALFTHITVPGAITNAQLDTINDMKITLNAYAIQAAGFDDAEDAWSKAPETWTEYSANNTN